MTNVSVNSDEPKVMQINIKKNGEVILNRKRIEVIDKLCHLGNILGKIRGCNPRCIDRNEKSTKELCCLTKTGSTNDLTRNPEI